MAERNLSVVHVTIWRWVQLHPRLNQPMRREMRPPNRSWRVDETHAKVGANRTYVYRRSILSARRSTSRCHSNDPIARRSCSYAWHCPARDPRRASSMWMAIRRMPAQSPS